MELGKQKLGQYVDAEEKFEDGKLKIELQVSAAALLVPALEKLKEVLPGHFEDALIDAAIEKLKAPQA